MSRQQDWEELQASIRACTRCRTAGHPVVPGSVVSGPSKAEIVLVGQAPGAMESETRVPFCGPSGRRLFSWVSEAGWAEDEFRDRVYLTALTKCYPGKARGGRGDRVPSVAERKLCAPFLEAELRLVQPKVVVTVGRMAAERFMGAGGLSTRIGKAFRIDGRIVVPLPHPSGANLWLNPAPHRDLVERAVERLREVRLGRLT
ncbi:MAG: uracil-DNA glycosylase family protein [Candidatus Bipolaricaulota bacterium]